MMPGPLGSPGYGRPWSPSSAQYVTSPRQAVHGPLSAGGTRYNPYPQLSPTQLQYTPSYVVGSWVQTSSPQQEISEAYTGTGYHHLLDQTVNRSPDTLRQDSSSLIAQSTIAQRRLHRGNSYTYGAEMHPLHSMSPRDDTAYGRMGYTPLPLNQQLSSQPIQPQPISATGAISPQIMHDTTFPASSSPSSQTYIASQSSYPPSRQEASHNMNAQFPVDPQLSNQQPQVNQEFAIPTRRANSGDNPPQSSSSPSSNPHRPKIGDSSNPSSSTSVLTFNTGTTPSSRSTHTFPSSTPQSEIPRTTQLSSEYYSQPPEPYTSSYKPDVRPTSRSDSSSSQRQSLTPQTLADHNQIQDAIHEQHVDAAKQVLAVENGNDVGVIEYLDTLPQPTNSD